MSSLQQGASVIDGWLNMPALTRDEVLADPRLVKHLSDFGQGPEVFMEHSLEQLLAATDSAGVGGDPDGHSARPQRPWSLGSSEHRRDGGGGVLSTFLREVCGSVSSTADSTASAG